MVEKENRQLIQLSWKNQESTGTGFLSATKLAFKKINTENRISRKKEQSLLSGKDEDEKKSKRISAPATMTKKEIEERSLELIKWKKKS